MRSAYTTKLQTPSPSQGSSFLGSTLRCSDFNYSRVSKNYYGDSNEKQTGPNTIHRRQISEIYERRNMNYYGRSTNNNNDIHQTDSESSKKTTTNRGDSSNLQLSSRNNNLFIEQNNNNQLVSSELDGYQTPKKVQNNNNHQINKRQITSFSEQYGKYQNDSIQQKDQYSSTAAVAVRIDQTKEELKLKYLRYTTDHTRYSSHLKTTTNNNHYSHFNHKEQSLCNSNKSKQDQRRLQESPTKENEIAEDKQKQNNNSSTSSYSGFISRSPNKYYNRSQILESISLNEDQSNNNSVILNESTKDILNYKTRSAFNRDSIQFDCNTNRMTKSDKKDMIVEIEQYKKDLKDYQTQLQDYQEQLRNTLNKNRAELFDNINHSTTTTSESLLIKNTNTSNNNNNNYQNQVCFLDISQQQQNQQSTNLNQSKNYSRQSSILQSKNIFDSIHIDDNISSFDQSPQKVLDVINLDSTSSPFTKCESEIVKNEFNNESRIMNNNFINESKNNNNNNNDSGKLIKLKRVTSTYEYDNEINNKQDLLDKQQNNIIELNKQKLLENNNTQIKVVSSIIIKDELIDSSLQLQQSEILNKMRSISTNLTNKNNNNNSSDKINLSSNNIQTPTLNHKIDILTNNNDIKQQLIDQTIIQDNHHKDKPIIKEQIQSNETYHKAITNSYDKLKEIENRYKRVEEISKKYSHLYKSKLLSSTTTTSSSTTASIITANADSLVNSSSSKQSSNSSLNSANNINNINNNKLPSHISPVSLSSNKIQEINSGLKQTTTIENNKQIIKRRSITEQIKISAEQQQQLQYQLKSEIKYQKYMNDMNVNSKDQYDIVDDDSLINKNINETPRFVIDEGIKYFTTAKQILSLNQYKNININNNNFNKNKFNSNDVNKIEETLQNLSELDIIDNEENNNSNSNVPPTFRLSNLSSPSVTNL